MEIHGYVTVYYKPHERCQWSYHRVISVNISGQYPHPKSFFLSFIRWNVQSKAAFQHNPSARKQHYFLWISLWKSNWVHVNIEYMYCILNRSGGVHSFNMTVLFIPFKDLLWKCCSPSHIQWTFSAKILSRMDWQSTRNDTKHFSSFVNIFST